jgi:hypothetical protein
MGQGKASQVAMPDLAGNEHRHARHAPFPRIASLSRCLRLTHCTRAHPGRHRPGWAGANAIRY